MKKEGFTLVELLLVIVIIGIVSAFTIPNIMEAYGESRRKGGEAIEKVLIENLKLYNEDNKDDLWNINAPVAQIVYGSKYLSISDLYNLNPDIDMGQCLLLDSNSLVITHDKTTGDFKYDVKIVCSKDFNSSQDYDKIASSSDLASDKIYYKSK